MKKRIVRLLGYILTSIIILCSLDLPVYADDDIELPTLGYSLEMECLDEGPIDDNAAIYDFDSLEAEEDSAEIYLYATSPSEISYWSSFDTDYYYNQLENDYEREFWRGLEASCDKLLYTGEGSITATDSRTERVVLKGYSGSPDDSQYTVFRDRAVEIMRLFYASHPQYYFIKNGWSSGWSGYNGVYSYYFRFGVYSDFVDGEKRKAATEEYKKAIDTAINSIQKDTELNTLINIQEYICNLTEYNYDAANRRVDEEISKSQSAYSCFVMNNTVCSGYAHATQLLCNYYDIDSIVVFSYNHAWDIVKCEDNWYQIDSTWADQDGDIYYDYFLKSYTNYEAEMDPSHYIEDWMEIFLPAATLDSYIPYVWDSYGITLPVVSEAIVGTYTVDNSNNIYSVILCPNDNRNLNIYYTLDGTYPDEAKTKCYKYKAPIKLETEKQVNALQFIAVCDGYKDSAIVNVSVNNVKIKMLGASARSTVDSIEFDMQYEVSPEIYTDKSISIKTNDSLSDENVYSMSSLPAEFVSSDNMYKVTVPLYVKSKEMADICSVQFYQGTNPISTNYEQSFASYLKTILTKYPTESSEYKCAYKLAQLGDASQKYFGYDLQNPVNSITGITSNSKTTNDSAIANNLRIYHKPAFIDNSDEMDYIGTSLSLKDDVTINYYFSVSDSFDINALTISSSSEKATSVDKVGSNVIRISMKDVQYTDVKKIFKYKIFYDKAVAMEVDYSIGDYMAAVLSDSTKSSSLRTLCRALYSLTE